MNLMDVLKIVYNQRGYSFLVYNYERNEQTLILRGVEVAWFEVQPPNFGFGLHKFLLLLPCHAICILLPNQHIVVGLFVVSNKSKCLWAKCLPKNVLTRKNC